MSGVGLLKTNFLAYPTRWVGQDSFACADMGSRTTCPCTYHVLDRKKNLKV